MNLHAYFNCFVFYYSFHKIFLSFWLYLLDFFNYELQASYLDFFFIRIHKYNNKDLFLTRNQILEYQKNLLLYLFQFMMTNFLRFLFLYFDKLINHMNLTLETLLYFQYFDLMKSSFSLNFLIHLDYKLLSVFLIY